MKLNITPEDHLRGALLEPGFYPCVVEEIEEKTAKDGSAYAAVKFKVTAGSFTGAPLYTNFSEKAPGMSIDFFKACGYKLDPKSTTELDIMNTKGKKLMVSVVRGEYNGKPQNNVNGYKPVA